MIVCLPPFTRTQPVAPATSDRGGAEKAKKPMQTSPTPMVVTAAMRRTMKRYANVMVELTKAAAVLLVLRTAEVVCSSMTEGTQSCKDFTQTSHI